MSGNILYMIITGVCMLLSKFAGSMLQKKFAKYSASRINLSGAEIAKQMLDDAGLGNEVKITATSGRLTDHYNPRDKTVNLSEVVCNERNVAAAAVAAHECGHAIQHAKAYSALKMRSSLVPVVNLSSKYVNIVLMAGMVLAGMGTAFGPMVLLVGIVMFAMTTLFSLVTLPVEFDASRRALGWLRDSGITDHQLQSEAKDALKWAAMTYVVAAIASIGQLLYFVMRFMSARR